MRNIISEQEQKEKSVPIIFYRDPENGEVELASHRARL